MTGPLWRKGFDTVEGAVRPRLEDLIGTEQFAVAAGLMVRVQRTVQRTSERATRRVLHSLNLPAGSDVNRILAELGRLERQVTSLRRELEAAKAKGGPDDARGARTKRPARSPEA